MQRWPVIDGASVDRSTAKRYKETPFANAIVISCCFKQVCGVVKYRESKLGLSGIRKVVLDVSFLDPDLHISLLRNSGCITLRLRSDRMGLCTLVAYHAASAGWTELALAAKISVTGMRPA